MKNTLVKLALVFVVLIAFSCVKEQNGNTTKVTAVPINPTDLVATVLSINEIKLDWLDKSTNEAGFKIERKTQNGIFAVIGTVGTDITTFNDKGLTPSTTYIYRVVSFNSIGPSPTYSNEITVTTIYTPSLTTNPVADTTGFTAISGGIISNDGGSPVTARGIVWNTSPNPTVNLTSKTIDGTGIGKFSSQITGLITNTKYYVRAYATNSIGTAYGNELSFNTNAVDLKAGLLEYFPFTGNTNDSIDNQRYLFGYRISLSTDRFNNLNRAYEFINGYLGQELGFKLPPKEQTISFWFYISSQNATRKQCFIEYGDRQYPQSMIQISINRNNNNSIQIMQGWFGNENPPDAIQGIYDNTIYNKWNHLAFTTSQIEGSNFYLNGIKINKADYSKRFFVWRSPPGENVSIGGILLGMNFGGGDPYLDEGFNGKLDDLRIYNRALTPLEISYLATH